MNLDIRNAWAELFLTTLDHPENLPTFNKVCEYLGHLFESPGHQPQEIPFSGFETIPLTSEEIEYLWKNSQSGMKVLHQLKTISFPRVLTSAEDTVWKATLLFNEGLFFETHEVLEKLWLEETGAARRFYQGFIQIAVGFYHLKQKNILGAITLLDAGNMKLKEYPPVYFHICMTDFVSHIEQCLGVLHTAEDETGFHYEQIALPHIEFRLQDTIYE